MIEIEFLNRLNPEVRNLLLRILLAALALLLIWLLRKLISAVILLPLRRLVVERTETKRDDLLIDLLENPVRMLIIALGITIAGEILTADVGTTLFFSNLSRTFVILAVFVGLYSAVDLIIESSMRLKYVTGISLDEQLLPFIRAAFKVVIIAIAIIIILQEWNYDVSGLIAGLGLGGLAFSLAAQDTVANLFAFTTIISDSPLRVGEYIKTPDVEGVVEQVGMRNARIRQLDQGYVTVPNSKLTSGPILNWSRLSKRWINFTLGVSYNTSSGEMRTLLERIRELLLAHERVDPDSVVVLFTDFGDSALNILIRCYLYEPDWVKFHEYKQDINLQIMDIVAEMGLSIAFPSQSLYIENLPPLPLGQGDKNRQIVSGEAETDAPDAKG